MKPLLPMMSGPRIHTDLLLSFTWHGATMRFCRRAASLISKPAPVRLNQNSEAAEDCA
jgi:hypothetical protein